MLKIWYGHNFNTEINANDWMEHGAPDDVLLHDFSKRAIKDIDKSEVLGKYALYSDPFGGFSPERLSEGVKAVLFLKYGIDEIPDHLKGSMLNLRVCGDNCYPYICEIANEKDIEVCSTVYVDVFKYGYKGSVLVMNDSTFIDNGLDLLYKCWDFREEILS